MLFLNSNTPLYGVSNALTAVQDREILINYFCHYLNFGGKFENSQFIFEGEG